MKELEIGQFYKYSGTFQVEYFQVIDEDQWKYFIKDYFYKNNNSKIISKMTNSDIHKNSGIIGNIKYISNRKVIQELFT